MQVFFAPSAHSCIPVNALYCVEVVLVVVVFLFFAFGVCVISRVIMTVCPSLLMNGFAK